MLTVPEQYAGQLMKCPLCSGTFTVPALPAGAPMAAPTAEPLSAAATAGPPTAPPAAEPEVYSLRSDGAGAAPAHPQDLVAAAPSPAPGAPAAPQDAPPMPLEAAAGPTTVPAPTPRPLPPEGYRHVRSLWIRPHVLPWIAPACLVVVFILLWFDWVKVSPGPDPLASASGWGAIFGGGAADPDLRDTALIGKAIKQDAPTENPFASASGLGIVYCLLFLLIALPVGIASVVLDRVKVNLPPGIQMAMPWRWGIVALACALVFLFLATQLTFGFGMETAYKEWVESNVKKDAGPTTPEKKVQKADQGMAKSALHYGWALAAAFLLHVVAVVSSALMFWVDRRGPSRPPPRIDLLS
jgi:hypothetical protein